MAHHIDFQTGKAAFVSLKSRPWHGLGAVIESEMSVEQAVRLAQLDFEVAKLPNRHHIPDGNGGMIEKISSTSFFTYRTDTNFVLGDRLGKHYTVVQNEDALGVVDALVAKGNLIIETAGSIHNGCTVFMTLRLSEAIKVSGKDDVQQYIVIAAGHDGGTPIMAFYTNVRVVCHNTLQLAISGAKNKISIRHTSSAQNRLNEAIRILARAEQNTPIVSAAYDRMARREVSKQEFFDYVGNIFCTPKEITALNNGEKADEVLSTRKSNIIGDVLSFAQTGIGQDLAGPGSMWWAYNAVTGYYANEKQFKSADHRMDGLLWGSQAATMETALALANAPEKIIPLSRKASALSPEQLN